MKITCPICKGSGGVLRVDSSVHKPWDTVQCPACLGSEIIDEENTEMTREDWEEWRQAERIEP